MKGFILLWGLMLLGFSMICQTPATENFINGSIDLIHDAYYTNKNSKARKAYMEKMQKRKTEMQEYYTSLAPYPDSIAEGWHDVIVMNAEDLCTDRKVYVKKNKIVKYVIDDWLERKVNMSGPIRAGKVGIQIEDPTEFESGLLTVYFFNYIGDNTSFSTPPLKPAVVTFWTSYKFPKYLSFTFDDMYLGKFEKKFDKDAQINCTGEFGTFTIRYKPGTYTYDADGSSAGMMQRKWKGEVILKEGECLVIPLN